MKRRILLTFAILAVFVVVADAQNYRNVTDTIWGKNYSAQIDGHATASCSDEHKILSTYPTKPADAVGNQLLCYYVHIPEGHAKADLVIRTRNKQLPIMQLVLTNPVSGDTLLVNQVQCTAINAVDTLALLPDMVFPEDTWYRLELSCISPENPPRGISEIKYWLFKRESSKGITTARIQSALATYLNWQKPTNQLAPANDAYEWCYTEVMTPADMEQINTYYSVMNFIGGYLGIQTPRGNTTKFYEDFYHNVLFSMWDNGDTDKDPTLPDYLKSSTLDASADVNCRRFGGEGTGCQAFLEYGEGDNWWRPGEWVQILTAARPQDMTITTIDENGKESTFTYNYTLVTMWYKMANDDKWYYMATHRKSAATNFFNGWGAFLENWAPDNGSFKRIMYYRNSFMKTVGSNTWYPCNQVKTGYYYDPSRLRPDQRDRRLDFDFGIADEYDNCFWMWAGGYSKVNDGVQRTYTVPATNDFTPVDTINLDRLWNNVERAIVKEGRNIVFTKLAASSNETTIMNTLRSAVNDSTGYAFRKVEYDNLKRMYNYGNPDVTLESIYATLLMYGYDIINRGGPNKIPKALRRNATLEPLLALAKELIESENNLDGYRTADLEMLKEAYADGTCDNVGTLFDTIVEFAQKSEPLIYRKVGLMRHIGGAHAYVLTNTNNRGTIKAKDGELMVVGAGLNNATAEAKTPVDYTDNGVNWTIVHFDGDAEYYLYNIAEEKFLDMTDTPTFTDMPVGLTIGVSGDKFYFSKNGKYLAVNPSTGAPVTTTTSLSSASYFNLIDNITMQPALSVSGKARDAVEAFKNFATNVENLGKILDIPEGCVGYISDPTRRQQITELYNDGNVSTSKMEEVLNAIKSEEGRITFSPDEKVYRLHSCYADRAAAPIAQLRENLGFKTEAKSENPAQMWVLKGKNEYYMMNIQGKAFAAIDDMSGKQPKVTDKDAAVATAVHDMGGYRFAIASSPTATYGFGAMSPSSCRSALVSGESGQWWLEEVNGLEITTNASGLAPLYYDFDVVLPEGLKAYTVRGVDANGVIDAVEIAAEVIPAGTPLILLGAPATAYTLTVKAYGNGEVSAQNLVGNYMENTGMTANEYYVLGADGTTPVMNLSTVSTLGANQVYLPKAADMGDLTKLTFKFSEPTGIDVINADESDMLSPRYNLKGQRVGKDAKGVIIQNGKKTINR